MRLQRRLIDSGETSWLRRAAAAVAPTAPPCPGTTWKSRSRGGVSCGLKRAPPVLGASTRARLSSGTHHPDADVVSEDLQGDREVPVVERNSIARAKWPAGKIAPRERGAAAARLMRTGSAIRQASQEGLPAPALGPRREFTKKSAALTDRAGVYCCFSVFSTLVEQ